METIVSGLTIMDLIAVVFASIVQFKPGMRFYKVIISSDIYQYIIMLFYVDINLVTL
jgi:hypothetical protein